jgi:hypothetical protein
MITPYLLYEDVAIHFKDPRTGQPYFDVSQFTLETLGQLGTARRRFFHGRGINNWDMALLRTAPWRLCWAEP